MVLIQKGRTEQPSRKSPIFRWTVLLVQDTHQTLSKPSCWAGCFLLGVSWAGCRADMTFSFVFLTAGPVPGHVFTHGLLFFFSQKSTRKFSDMFGHERDLGCVFESPFFKRKSAWDCTSHRGWSFVWGQRGSWGPLVTENSAWEVLIFHHGYMKWPGLKPRVWWISIFPKNTSAFRSAAKWMFQGCPALAPWPPGPSYFIFSQIFWQDKTSKHAHEKIQFRHLNLVLLEKGWDRMRKEGGGLPT